MFGGARQDRHAEAGEVVRLLVVLGPVRLVRDDRARHAALAHALEDLLVQRRHARAHVHHDEAHRRVGDGERRLLPRLGGERVLAARRAVEREAARVDEHEALAVRLDLAGHAVARDAGLVEDDGDAPPRDAVEEGALAHVGAADDRDDATGLADCLFVHSGNHRA